MRDRWLKAIAFDDDLIAALKGEKVPEDLGNEITRLCLVRGIRDHAGFALHPQVAELAAMKGQEIFARARNARLIMSGVIPDEDLMATEATQPYCIWYPDVAPENIYKRLCERYPSMRYQVGRACAVAGYFDLYKSLSLVPDVSIAEEARENHANVGAQKIYRDIMKHDKRYNAMDDYTRTIKEDTLRSGPQGNLLGNTAVRAGLEIRTPYIRGWGFSVHRFCSDQPFDITEDGGIIDPPSFSNLPDFESPILSDVELDLFTGPLPSDLPTVNKNLLILVAAYTGNIERYLRLRYKTPIKFEIECLAHGCRHNPYMAAWVTNHPEATAAFATRKPWSGKYLRRSIQERRVMDNDYEHLLDTSTAAKVPDDELPEDFWSPKMPSNHVLFSLAQKRPVMMGDCLRACICFGNREAYDAIIRLPNTLPIMDMSMVVGEAMQVPDTYFRQDLADRGFINWVFCNPVPDSKHLDQLRDDPKDSLDVIGSLPAIVSMKSIEEFFSRRERLKWHSDPVFKAESPVSTRAQKADGRYSSPTASEQVAKRQKTG